jgi:hemerythrin-like domain-containing protein
MQARGMLMKEHRCIEKMIGKIRTEIEKIQSAEKGDPVFIDTAVDFIRTYADRTHHGKEEDILFRDLHEKQLSEKDRKIMEELIDEHVFGRQTTTALDNANRRYRAGDETALAEIIEMLGTLTEFYPKHIEKEDAVFFPASRTYFSDEEERAMIAEFQEFDRQMIHEKYRNVAGEPDPSA